MFVPILMFIVGLVLLIKGGDWFVDSATGIARRFKLPEILIGATVVSIGTTLPEVMVSAQGAIQGSGAMAYGNAIGSIICNTSLIAAITIAIKPGRARKKVNDNSRRFLLCRCGFLRYNCLYDGKFLKMGGNRPAVNVCLVYGSYRFADEKKSRD